MRRYISICVVALVAMFAATSCQLDSGTTPRPNRASQLLWNRVSEALAGQQEHLQMAVWLNDYILGAEWSEINKPWLMEESEGVYLLSNSVPADYITYRIHTNGKRLDEGGEWIIYVKYGSYMEFAKIGIVKGVEGENTKFAIDCEVHHQTPYYNAIQSIVEYSFDTTAEEYEIVISECKGITADQGSTVSYKIDFEVIEPLVYRSATLYSGEIDILYSDFVENTTRLLTVQIANKIITFAPKQPR